MLDWTEVADGDYLGPREGHSVLYICGGAVRASCGDQMHTVAADVLLCLRRQEGGLPGAGEKGVSLRPPQQAEAGHVVTSASVIIRLPNIDCRAGAGDGGGRWIEGPAEVLHQPADGVSRQRRQRGLVAAPGRPRPVQRDEARVVGGLSAQLGGFLWADAVLPRPRRPAEGGAELKHDVVV